MAKAISWEQDDYKIVVMSVDPNRLPKLKNGSDATSDVLLTWTIL
jgi:hypothetical protein